GSLKSASASREGASSIAAHVRRRGRGRGRRRSAGDGGVAPGAMRLPARPRQPVGLGLGLGLPPRARTGALLGAGGEWCSAATDWVRSYCLSTGQHGYRYLAENGLRLSERGLWLAVIVASTAMSAYIIGITWSLYEGNPTLTVIEDSHYNTWNFPFPAVTICGINQLDRDKSAEFVQKLTVLNGMSREEIFEDLRLLPTFFDLDADEDLDHNYTRLQKVLDANNITVKQVMKEISPNCEDMVYRCMWKGRELLSCKKTFKDLKTKRLNIDTTPKRVSACGKTTGLSIILRNQLDQYFDTFLASYGFKIEG
ncbi:Sodium channel protein Nach, partial [Gryllus bimaculatus]